jgi:hypothetical protein
MHCLGVVGFVTLGAMSAACMQDWLLIVFPSSGVMLRETKIKPHDTLSRVYDVKYRI